jgi:hypothetical protein
MGHKGGARQEGSEDAATVHQQQNATQKNVIKWSYKKELTWATRVAPTRKVVRMQQPYTSSRMLNRGMSSNGVLKRDQHGPPGWRPLGRW